MAGYYYAAHFNTPLNQSPALPASYQPFGISSHPSNLPISRAKPQHQEAPLPATERRILFADGKVLPQQPSIFFRLSAELRNQIYAELLCAGAPSAKALAEPTFHAHKPPPLYPAILSACRRSHDEATAMLYTTHVFHAHPSLLTSLPHLASPAQPVLHPTVLAQIQRWQLTLRLDTDPRFTMAQATAAFSGAEFLDIRVWQSTFDGCDSSVLRLFLGVRGVKVARVGGSADEKLARWLEKRMMGEVEVDVDVCGCGDESGVVKCGQCGKKVDGDEWFARRNAWQFGNR
jgi:hypothetical protein